MRIKMPAVRIAQADSEPVPQDMLTCGVCQKPFALADIVKFIQHKVLACNKENFYSGGDANNTDSDDAGGGGSSTSIPLGVVNTRRPSISAPITTKKVNAAPGRLLCTPPPTPASPRLDMLLDEPASSTPKRRAGSASPIKDEDTLADIKPCIKQEALEPGMSSPEDAVVIKRSRIDVVDAESNTTHSEPSNYVCSTCKQRLHSAWRLVQHVQNTHGIKIYVESSPSASSTGSASSTSPSGLLGKSNNASGHSNNASNNNNHSSSSSSSCSGSSTASGCSSTSSGNGLGGAGTSAGTPLPLPPPGVSTRLSLHHHTQQQQQQQQIPPSSPLVDSHHGLHNSNPFGVGGLLRMPLGDRSHHPQYPPAPPTSMAAPLSNHLGSHHHGNGPTASLFARPSSHHEHHFRMEQLVSEQFRLNPHHGLGLAAAVAAAAAGVPPHHPPFGPPTPDRVPSSAIPTSTTPRSSVPPPPPLALSLEPQLDFYSQRLRQLAGTTSPGAANGTSSPSPRKQILTPPFTSPSGSHHPPTSSAATTPIMHNNNNNISATNNNTTPNSTQHSSPNSHNSHRPDSLSSPEKQSPLSDPVNSTSQPVTTTPRSASTPPTSMKTSEFSRSQLSLTGQRDENGERIRSCEFCGKKFRFQSNLIVHRRTHTGEKPYKCAVCNHACSQSSKLKRHMKIHRRALRGNGTVGGEMGTPTTNTGGSTHSTPDNVSHAGSVETLDEDGDDEDDDEDDEEEEEEEEEEMELEEEEGDDDDDDDLGGDAPEDLTTKSTSSTPPNNVSGEANKGASTPRPTPTATPLEKIATSGSLVGELMDKFGLSNIQQYNEAYKQALQESVVGSHHLHIKDELHRSPLIADNNNGGKSTPPVLSKTLENGLMEKSAAAMRFREEFAKNIIAAGQPPLDLIGAPHGLFGTGSPFENPFDAANKRLKLDLENHHHQHHSSLNARTPGPDRDSLYAGLWLPAMAAAHHRDAMFGGDTSAAMDLLTNRQSKNSENALLKATGNGVGSKAGPSASSLAAAAAAALNLGLPGPGVQQSIKKDSRRNDTCEYCGKVFKNCSNLTVHRRSHTGEKPYKCELCSYACAQSSKLTRHMKTHGRIGKDVYRCRFCEMPFSVPSTLEKHMRKCVVNQNNKAGGGHLLPALISGEDTGDSSASASKDTT